MDRVFIGPAYGLSRRPNPSRREYADIEELIV
jgi:hypothetical protein